MDLGQSLSSCAHCGVDIHCHVVPSQFPNSKRRGEDGGPVRGWPSMTLDGCGHATVVIDDKPYRTVREACWLAERRLEDMDKMGIRCQALSPMPELFSYWIDSDAATDLCRYMNDMIAALVLEGRGRFVGLGSVPLHDSDNAIAELHRIMKILGFRGVEIGSNINNVPIGHPQFHPFFAEAERLNAAVFVHAIRPAGMDRLVGPAPLQQILGYPTDVGLAAASVLTSNLLHKFPRLRIAFSHGGGTLPALLPRLEQGYTTFPALKTEMVEAPSIAARRLYVDSLVFDPNMLRFLVETFGEDRILVGTDYPFNFCDDDVISRIEATFDNARIRKRLNYENAIAFLALDTDCING